MLSKFFNDNYERKQSGQFSLGHSHTVIIHPFLSQHFTKVVLSFCARPINALIRVGLYTFNWILPIKIHRCASTQFQKSFVTRTITEWNYQTPSPRWLRYHPSEASCLLYRAYRRAHFIAAIGPIHQESSLAIIQIHCSKRPCCCRHGIGYVLPVDLLCANLITRRSVSSTLCCIQTTLCSTHDD